MKLRPFALLLASAALAACAQFPELEDAGSKEAWDADFPELLPVEDLRATAPDPIIEEDTGSGLESRADRLRARAARLKGSVVDPATKTRLKKDITLDEG